MTERQPLTAVHVGVDGGEAAGALTVAGPSRPALPVARTLRVAGARLPHVLGWTHSQGMSVNTQPGNVRQLVNTARQCPSVSQHS